MFTVESLQQYPALVKAFTGVPADEFWGLVAAVAEQWTASQGRRRERPDRYGDAGFDIA
jgi:hypothetical protein